MVTKTLLLAFACLACVAAGAEMSALRKDALQYDQISNSAKDLAATRQFMKSTLNMIKKQRKAPAAAGKNARLLASAECEAAADSYEALTGPDGECDSFVDRLSGFLSNDITQEDMQTQCGDKCLALVFQSLFNVADKCDSNDDANILESIAGARRFIEVYCLQNENDQYCTPLVAQIDYDRDQSSCVLAEDLASFGCCVPAYLEYVLPSQGRDESQVDQILNEIEQRCNVEFPRSCIPPGGEAHTVRFTVTLTLNEGVDPRNPEIIAAVRADVARALRVSPSQVEVALQEDSGAARRLQSSHTYAVTVMTSTEAQAQAVASQVDSLDTSSFDATAAATGANAEDITVSASEPEVQENSSSALGIYVSASTLIVSVVGLVYGVVRA